MKYKKRLLCSTLLYRKVTRTTKRARKKGLLSVQLVFEPHSRMRGNWVRFCTGSPKGVLHEVEQDGKYRAHFSFVEIEDWLDKNEPLFQEALSKEREQRRKIKKEAIKRQGQINEQQKKP